MMQQFKCSWQILKQPSSLPLIGMLVTLGVVLSYLNIDITSFRIGFSFLATAITGFLMGPSVGAVFGVTADTLKFFIKPSGAYFPGYALNEVLAGIIYGLFLFRKPLSVKRVFAAKLCISVIVNMGLTTLWMTMMTGKGFMVLFPIRAAKNLLMLPLEVFILYFTLKALQRIPEFRKEMVK